MKLGKREHDKFTGGWSQTAFIGDRTFRVVLSRQRYVGMHYGKRAFEWSGYVYENGRCIYSVDAHKGTSLKRIVSAFLASQEN